MKVIETLSIDKYNYLAEDNVKLMNLKYLKKEIETIEIGKECLIIKSKDNTYSSPTAIGIEIENSINRYLLLKIFKKSIKRIFRNSKTIKGNTKRIFSKIYLVNRQDVSCYEDLINLNKQVNREFKDFILIIDWIPNILETAILNTNNLICINRTLKDLNNYPSLLPPEVIFLAHHLDASIMSSKQTKDKVGFQDFSKKYVKEYIESRKKMKNEINIVIEAEYPLEYTKKPIGFQDRELWHPKSMGNSILEVSSNIFIKNDTKELTLENVEEIIKYGLNLISSDGLKNFKSEISICLPGLLLPSDLLMFDLFVEKARLDGVCFQFRSNGTSFISIHTCSSNKCEMKFTNRLSFHHFQAFHPKISKREDKSRHSKMKKICMVLPPYTRASGGIVAMYRLHDYLKENGFEVYVLPYNPTGSFTYFKRFNLLFQDELSFDHKEAIWIYSDTVSSIPVDADIQIQWLMNRPGYLPATSTGTFRIRPNYIFKYSNVISDEIKNKLYISNFNFDLFHPRKFYKKIGPSFYFGKSSSLNILDFNKYFQKEYQVITRTHPVREDLPDLLTASSILISLDTLSAINIEANLCGTPTLVVANNKSKFKELDIRKFELPTTGIIFDINELDRVPKLDKNFFDYFKSESDKLEETSLKDFLIFLEKL